MGRVFFEDCQETFLKKRNLIIMDKIENLKKRLKKIAIKPKISARIPTIDKKKKKRWFINRNEIKNERLFYIDKYKDEY